MVEAYDIFTDKVIEVNDERLAELYEIKKAYMAVRALVAYCRTETDGWEASDKLRSFIMELEQVHIDLVVRLGAKDP